MIPKLTEKERSRQIGKEAKITLVLFLVYFIWWCVTGYVVGGAEKDHYTYIYGMALWFFLSSVVGYVLFSVATIIIVKTCFRNFDLDETADDDEPKE